MALCRTAQGASAHGQEVNKRGNVAFLVVLLLLGGPCLLAHTTPQISFPFPSWSSYIESRLAAPTAPPPV